MSVIDTDPSSADFNTVVATIPVAGDAQYMAITPDGTRAYVSNTNSSTVSVIDTDPSSLDYNTEVASISVGSRSRGVAIAPDGTRAYVTNTFSGNMSVIDTDPSSADFNTVVATVSTVHFTFGVAITPDGTRAYATNALNPIVSVIDTDPSSLDFNTVLATVVGVPSSVGVAITPTPPTPEEVITTLIEDVDELLAEGSLDAGAAAGLNATLDTALRLVTDNNARNDIGAKNALLAFVNMTQGLIDRGDLSSADGQAMIDAALAAVDEILAGG